MKRTGPNPINPIRQGSRAIHAEPSTLHFAVLAALALGSNSLAQSTNSPAVPASSPGNDATRLPDVVVRGRDDSLIGIASSASDGTVGAVQLEARPLSRPGEVLETVPGLILTQHSGAGKANQFFLRGFNLDHGTDFLTRLDGVPVNLPTHAHGQGYTDLNILIPELIDRVDFRKGPYHADVGDFGSAGSADIHYANSLDHGIAQVEGGSFGYARGVFAASPQLGSGRLLYGVELYHNDGPWIEPDDYQRINAVTRYSQGDDSLGWSVTAMAYKGVWNATDQLAQRAIEVPGFSRFGTLDDSTGGDSQRYALSTEWHRADADSATRVQAYGIYYDLDLFSNFTYRLTSSQGDQMEQQDRRWVGGATATHTWYGHLLDRDMENTVGLQLRSDSIRNGLYQTADRQRLDKTAYDGSTIPAITRSDRVWECTVSPYVENKVQWGESFRSVLGGRADYAHFDVDGTNPGDSGNRDAAIVSPKGSLIFGPWAKTELYVSGGLGFHSNDARGVVASADPADPLVRTYGAEVGVRSTALPGLQSTVSLWWLDIDSELVFVGDAGNTEASRPSRRYGIEFANYYTPTPWLTLDADLSLSNSRFRDDDPAGRHIPGSVETVVAAGVSVQQPGDHGFFGGIRLRYFGPRPLIEDDSVRSSETILVSLRAGYRFNRTWTLSAEVFNLLDRRDSEIDYFYASRLPGEPVGPVDGGYEDIHFHPVDPISFRVALTANF